MYNRDKLEEYAHKIYARYDYFNNYTLETIARRLKATGRLSAYDQQALKNIADITGDMQAITKKLAEIAEQSTQDIEKAYAQVVSDGVNTYKPLYDFKGMRFVPFEENDYAQQLVRHWAKETAGTMLNITKTKALCFDSYDVHGRFTGSTPLAVAYENAMTEAVTALTSGTVSFDTALAETVERLGGSGVKVDYSSGVTRELSGMVRQNILYGAKQAARAYDEYIGAQLDCDGFEVDAHSGCRPSHEFMQGQLYAYDGTKTVDGVEYEDGTAALSALEDYGCLHFKTDIILGISQPRYSPEELERIRRETSEMIEYNGRSKTRYGWKQTQRALERAVKTELQKANMCKAAGLTRRADEHTQKAKTYRAAYDDLCAKTGLEPRYERMRVYAPSGMKTVDKNGKSGIIDSERGLHMNTGGILDNGALNPDKEEDFEAAQKHAMLYYDEIRGRKSDIAAIAKNTNWDEKDIETVKNHIFINRYDLGGDEMERFYPHYDIAVSWQNLIDGKKIEEKDIMLLKHELYEYRLMTEKNMGYREAHKIAESEYNYSEAVKEWRKNNESIGTKKL